MGIVVHLLWGKLPHAGEPWSDHDDADLLALHAEDFVPAEMIQTLGRTPDEIAARLEELKPKAAVDAPVHRLPRLTIVK